MNTNLKLPYHDLEQSKLIFSKDLKKWYLKNSRQLPWRGNKEDPNYPYKILVSEFMLQQTGVKTVIPYFERFIAKWPDIKSLAKASENEILSLIKGISIVAKKIGVSDKINGGGYRSLVNVGENGGQEVPHLHFHIFGGEKIGKMVS